MFSEQNLISDNDTFKKFIYTCLDENIISMDTEFVRNKTFFSQRNYFHLICQQHHSVIALTLHIHLDGTLLFFRFSRKSPES